MPFVADLNDWQISTMEELGKARPCHRAQVRRADQGPRQHHEELPRQAGRHEASAARRPIKQEEEVALQKFIDADPQRKTTYGTCARTYGQDLRRNDRHGRSTNWCSTPADDFAAAPVRERRFRREPGDGEAQRRARGPVPRRCARRDEEGVERQLRELPRAGRAAVLREGHHPGRPRCPKGSASPLSTRPCTRTTPTRTSAG